jgi:hypothetical protein
MYCKSIMLKKDVYIPKVMDNTGDREASAEELMNKIAKGQISVSGNVKETTSKKKKSIITNSPKKGFKENPKKDLKKSASIAPESEKVIKEDVLSKNTLKSERVTTSDKFYMPTDENINSESSGQSFAVIPKNRNTIFIAIAVVVFLLLLSVFIVKPSILGYSVYQELESSGYTVDEFSSNLNELNANLELTKVNLSSHVTLNDKLFLQIRETSDRLLSCEVEKERISGDADSFKLDLEEKNVELESMEVQINEQVREKVEKEVKLLGEQKAICLEDLSNKDEEYQDLAKDYDDFVRNVAKSVCCKAKVDNSNIDAYEVINDKLVCLEDGGKSLSC